MRFSYDQERWERVRAQGIFRFLLTRGVLGFGIGLALIWVVIVTLLKDGATLESFISDNFVARLKAAALVFPIVGILWALRKWTSLESRYSKP